MVYIMHFIYRTELTFYIVYNYNIFFKMYLGFDLKLKLKLNE
jgi:hypothetical protein